ncbi:hypothetical protein NliqN6_0060 [Naganishia liquefaciens]|uniref:Uncharacterized protein n=1 Tax=Naganishia liquefaciens TaxID=104408 RepID=A0A8H3TMU3_9TREE|nr:hypothetical protein NliqN6_0060 [Naganishia liquefaciens]
MKRRKRQGSPWLTPRSVIRAGFLACITITCVNLDLVSLARTISSYSERLLSDNTSPSSSDIRKDDTIVDPIRVKVQDPFVNIIDCRPDPDSDSSKGFDFAKATRACGWPDIHGFGITAQTLVDCLQAEHQKFEENRPPPESSSSKAHKIQFLVFLWIVYKVIFPNTDCPCCDSCSPSQSGPSPPAINLFLLNRPTRRAIWRSARRNQRKQQSSPASLAESRTAWTDMKASITLPHSRAPSRFSSMSYEPSLSRISSTTDLSVDQNAEITAISKPSSHASLSSASPSTHVPERPSFQASTGRRDLTKSVYGHSPSNCGKSSPCSSENCIMPGLYSRTKGNSSSSDLPTDMQSPGSKSVANTALAISYPKGFASSHQGSLHSLASNHRSANARGNSDQHLSQFSPHSSTSSGSRAFAKEILSGTPEPMLPLVLAKNAARVQRDVGPAADTTLNSLQGMVSRMTAKTQSYIAAAPQGSVNPVLAKKHLAGVSILSSNAEEVDSSRVNTFVYPSLDSSPQQRPCYNSPPQAVAKSPLETIEEDPLDVLDREIAAAKAAGTFSPSRSSLTASSLSFGLLSPNKWQGHIAERMSADTQASSAFSGTSIRSRNAGRTRESGSGMTGIQRPGSPTVWSPLKLDPTARNGVSKVPGPFALPPVTTPYWRTEPAESETPTKFTGLQPATSLHYLPALNPVVEAAEPVTSESSSIQDFQKPNDVPETGSQEDHVMSDAFSEASLPSSPARRLTLSGRPLIATCHGKRWVTPDYLTKSIAFLEVSDDELSLEATPPASPEKMQVDSATKAQQPVGVGYYAPPPELTHQGSPSEVQALGRLAYNSPPEARAFWSNHRYVQGTPTPLTITESAESLVHVASFGEIINLAQAQLPVVKAGASFGVGKAVPDSAQTEHIAAPPGLQPIPTFSRIPIRAPTPTIRAPSPIITVPTSKYIPDTQNLDRAAEKPSINAHRVGEKRKQDSRQTPLVPKADVKRPKDFGLLREALLSGQVAMPALRTPKDTAANKRKQDSRLTPLEPRIDKKKPRDYSPRYSSPLAANNENSDSSDTAASRPLSAAERRKRQNEYSKNLRRETLALRPSDRANRIL